MIVFSTFNGCYVQLWRINLYLNLTDVGRGGDRGGRGGPGGYGSVFVLTFLLISLVQICVGTTDLSEFAGSVVMHPTKTEPSDVLTRWKCRCSTVNFISILLIHELCR